MDGPKADAILYFIAEAMLIIFFKDYKCNKI